MTSLDSFREILTSAEIALVIEYLHSLAPRNASERALKLKERYPKLSRDSAMIALETAIIREHYQDSATWEKRGFFLQSSYEQATRTNIASHHAQQFKGLKVFEIGCGIGFDSAAIAKTALSLTAIDSNPLCCAIAEYNLALQGIKNVTFVCANFKDFVTTTSIECFDAIWADPARRESDGERIFDPELYHPPLSSILTLPFDGKIGIKVSPALNIWDLNPEWSHEFIGWQWGCPEQVLWKGSQHPARLAHLADIPISWHKTSDILAESGPNSIASDNYLLEPHPALVRTNQCEYFFAEHNFDLLDPHLPFGISATAQNPSPWFRQYQIIESFRFSLKKLKKRLHELNWDSRTQIKKRGVREQPDEIHRALKLPKAASNSSWGFVILLKIDNSPTAILAGRTVKDHP